MDNNKPNFDDIIKNLESQRQEAMSTDNVDEKTKRVARLIVLLSKLETELDKVQTVLHTIWENARVSNRPDLMAQSTEKMERIDSMRAKITRARLELNITFM